MNRKVYKFGLLLKVQMLNLFSINKILRSRDNKERGQAAAMGVAWLIVIAVLVAYSALNAYACVQLGIVHALPSVMLMVCSLITLFLTFMKSSGVLFGMQDYDMVMSMPVNNNIVVLSRLAVVYIMNLLISFIVVAPSAVIYATNSDAPVSVYIMLALALFLTPLIPMTVAMIIGAGITAVSGRFKHKNIVAIIINIAVVLAIMSFSFTFQEGAIESFADLETTISEAVTGFYPPAALFSNAVVNNNWGSYVIFAFISVGILVLFTFVTAKFYSQINTAIFSYNKRNNYRISELKASGAFNALYRKELRRLLSCTIYAVNSCIGAILFIMAGVAVLFADSSQFMQELGLSEDIIKNYIHCVPFALSLFAAMSSTTSVSLSLEGKYRWLMCSAPVKSETVFNSKIAVNLTVLLPASVIGGALFSFALKTNIVQTIFMILIPCAYALFIAVAGMFINVKFPKYDWTSEYYAVKSGASVLITMLAGMVMPIAFMAVSIVFSSLAILIETLGLCLILLVTRGIYNIMRKIDLYA